MVEVSALLMLLCVVSALSVCSPPISNVEISCFPSLWLLLVYALPVLELVLYLAFILI